MDAIKTWKTRAAQEPPLAAAPSPADAARDSRALAERYDALSTRLEALDLHSSELLPRATRYQKLTREAAHALRDVAQAVERGDADGARRRRVEFDDIAKAEAPLVADINSICR